MTLRKSTAKVRQTPVKSVTPVIAVRVPESLHRLIKKRAEKSGRSMSDEVAFLFGQIFEWEKTFVSARKLLDDAHRARAGSLRQARISEGYTPISTSDGIVWAEPGSKISEAVRRELGEMRAKP